MAGWIAAMTVRAALAAGLVCGGLGGLGGGPLVGVWGGATSAHAAEALAVGASGLPLPRFVSLGSSKVNVRRGPSRRHKIKWTFVKSGLPVEIVREFGNWYRVRDADGEEGWIHRSLLRGERTVLVSPWTSGQTVPLLPEPDMGADPVAYLEPKVLASVTQCDGTWCNIRGADWRGVVPQRLLWGVYPDEQVD